MRHAKRTLKLGRKSQHRDAMLSNLVCSLIRHNRVKTTLAKAKAARPLAEKMVTLGKKGTLHHRRQAVSAMKQEDMVKKLFAEIAPKFQNRKGGYTRILKLGPRKSDASEMAFIEWVEFDSDAQEAKPASETPKKEKAKTA